MVLGLISLVFVCFSYVGVPLGIIAIVLGGVGIFKAKKAGMKNGMAVAGLVCSIISVAINVAVLVLAGSLIGSVFSMFGL